MCDDATDVTATCDRSRRDVPLPVRPKRPEELPDDGRDDGRSPRDDRALGDPSSDGDRLDLPLSSSAAKSSVGVFGSPSGTLVSGCIRRMSGGLEDEGSFGDKRGRPTHTKTMPKTKEEPVARLEPRKFPKVNASRNNAKIIKPACSKGMMKMGSYNPRASFIRYSQTATKRHR